MNVERNTRARARSDMAFLSLALFCVLASIGVVSASVTHPSVAARQQVQREAGAVPLALPYPGSTSPDEVLANVRAVVAQTSIAAGVDGMREILLGPGVRVRRILQVVSQVDPAHSARYLVIELETAGGDPVAVVGLSRAGEPIGLQDFRSGVGGDPSQSAKSPTRLRPLDLDDATRRVQTKIGGTGLHASYVYILSIAEPGISIFRPLVAVTTGRGTVYLNSVGEAFVENGTALARDLGVADESRPNRSFSKQLVMLGRW